MSATIFIKGVVIHDGRVLLLLNERGEWDLPGGRPDPGEDHRTALRREVREETVVVPLPWPGTPEEFLGYIRSDMVTFDSLLLRIAPQRREAVLDEVFTSIRNYDDGECLQFTAAIVVASAVR